jgi:integrase
MCNISGNLAEHINGLIQQKRALGYKYDEQERLLCRFSEMCNEFFPESSTITEEMAMKWCEYNNNFTNKYTQARAMIVNQLGKYIKSLGLPAYILPIELFPKGDVRVMPHIYTKEELNRIFDAADTIPRFPKTNTTNYSNVIVPAIIRLLYFCGLRPAEARLLKVTDVNLNTGALRINQSKGPNDRLVVMSDDMTGVLSEYNAKMRKIAPVREFFFPSSRTGISFTKVWINKQFNALLDRTGFDRDSENCPRLYDLRHTFATHVIQKWVNAGKDVDSMLLYLSAYMGHEKLSMTAYYVHLIPENFHKQNDISPYWYSELSED